MPWNQAQHRLFEAAARTPGVAQRVGIPVQTARKLASEGVRPAARGAMLAAKLK